MNYRITMKKDDFFKVHNRIRSKSLVFEDNMATFSSDKSSVKLMKNANYDFQVENILSKRLLGSIKKYYLLIVGVLFLFSILYINSFRVSDIVFSLDTPINQTITNLIKADYKSLFCFDFYTKSLTELETSLKKRYIDYPTLSLTKDNSVIYVDISKELTNDTKPVSHGAIIAKEDAVISDAICYKGNIKTAKNKYVKKGDVLIEADNNLAAGEILGYTYKKVNITVDKTKKEYVETENKCEYYNVSLFGGSFDTGKKEEYQASNTTSSNVFNFFDLFQIKKIVETENYAIIRNINTLEEAETLAKSDYLKYFNKNIINDREKIVDMKLYKATELDDSYSIVLIVKAIESIGEYEIE